MEIRVLKYFLAVARYGNITKAAEELHLTQPTLSRQLNELETELGRQLFIRGKRRITLTEEGEFLKARAAEIITLADSTAAALSQDETVSGDIFIGCGETEAMREVIGVVAQLKRRYHDLRFHLISGNEASITEKLKKGLLDFGLVCRETPPVEYVYRRLQHLDTWGLLMKSTNPLAQQIVITKDDLSQEPLIVSRQLMDSQEFDHWLGRPLQELNIVASYNLLHNTIFLAEQGMGSVLCFERIIPTSYERLVFRPLEPPLHSSNYIIWRKDKAFSRAASLVRDCFDKISENK